ncbi:3-hydroxypropanoate dehydrogenase [Faunimonas pinastri]|uniref:Putative NADH dehydrogenase/NAD(P)H nitroreductase SAMN05216548_108133 n=1 Tax=Faunimonas pinastri TaxID=1855383 RepID=A0A1H9JI25_9HYPH|nr:malonic semialdehyde reductase [Faunimonas pinastri]SEQ86439.1 3-hydroxypropanoate dehydrogenase [Faunimonas pinastri]
MTLQVAENTDIELEHRKAREAILRVRHEVASADPDTLRMLFTEARTHNGWLDRPVTDEQLHQVYELAKFGPTALNLQSLRIRFLRSAEAKEKLRPALSPNNVDKTMSAPVVAIFASDTEFWRHFPKTFPHNPAVAGLFSDNQEAAVGTATMNATLQIAYFIIAARAVGLDCGPMGGFDKAKVDEAFFAGTTHRSLLVCNLGFGDPEKVFRRLPRLDFDEVAEVL